MWRVWCCICLAPVVLAILFDVEANGEKCLSEELPRDTDVVGTYEALPAFSQFVDMKVSDSAGKVVHDARNIDKHEFYFHTSSAGDYTFCFHNSLVPGTKRTEGMRRRVNLHISSGMGLVDYETVARREHLRPVEVSLRVMEDTVKSIHHEYHYLKQREAQLRDKNESIHVLAVILIVLTIVYVGSYATWQVFSWSRYFRQRGLLS